MLLPVGNSHLNLLPSQENSWNCPEDGVFPMESLIPFSCFSFSVLPSFIKTPHDVTSRTGTMVRLECAAEGHPTPQIAWQKDGGTDFPAARERRMHVMPDDDVFFITDVKIEDMGVYSCTAQNSAGSVLANANLTVLGKVHQCRERPGRREVGAGRDCCSSSLADREKGQRGSALCWSCSVL